MERRTYDKEFRRQAVDLSGGTNCVRSKPDDLLKGQGQLLIAAAVDVGAIPVELIYLAFLATAST